MIHHVKRKAASILGNDAEDLEHLPSIKRQRVTMEAMQRLFAKFTISDEPASKKETKTYPNKFLLRPENLISTDKNGENNNNSDNVFNLNEGVHKAPEPPEQRSEGRKQSIEEDSPKASSEENSSPIKRHAEYTSDEGDGTTTDMPRTKKVRQLKSGLRLCSSITCYIEQVLY